MKKIAADIDAAIRFARDRSADLAEYGVHPDFDMRGVVAPRVGAALHSLLTEPSRDWHDDPVGETAFGAYVRGDHDALPLLGQALRDEGHPFADLLPWHELPAKIDLDKRALAASKPELDEYLQYAGPHEGGRSQHSGGVYAVHGAWASSRSANPQDTLATRLRIDSDAMTSQDRAALWGSIRGSNRRLARGGTVAGFQDPDAKRQVEFLLSDIKNNHGRIEPIHSHYRDGN